MPLSLVSYLKSHVYWVVVFTPVLGIVLGDNKKNKSPTLATNRLSIRYELVLKN
jgi:hypothetical protein